MENDPIGFFITWTCYGTWLPGDSRGWNNWHRGYQIPQPRLEDWSRDQMADQPVILCDAQRQIVHETITDHCRFRGWTLHQHDCRTNHVHVVVSAVDYHVGKVRSEFKSWSTRRLKEQQRKRGLPLRKRWWARGGSGRILFDDDALSAAIQYVGEAQDKGGSKATE